MRLLLVPDPTSPNGEDAFCRELAKRAPARGHSTALRVVPTGPSSAVTEQLVREGFASEADAVFVNSLQPAALLAARAARRPAALRLIDNYEGASPDALVEVRRLALAADMLLVPSAFLKGQIRAWGAAEERIRVVPYAYDQIFAQQIALVTMRASRPTGFGIVTACALDESCRAGLETVFSALSRLRLDWHLAVIGEGPARDELRARCEALMIVDRVTFIGDLPHPKKMEYLRAAKAYIEPTGRQGFPSLTLHAFSEGCPVVGVRAGAVPEIVRNGENGLLYEPGDAQALAEEILNLAATPGLSLKLIAEGVRTVERHSWDATAAATLDALESMEVRAR